MGDNYPRITPNEMSAAKKEIAFSTGAAVVEAVGVGVGYYKLGAPLGALGNFIQKGFTGHDIKPAVPPATKPTVSFPRLSIPGLLAPQPVGLVPPEAYGLPPKFWRISLGFPIGNRPKFLFNTEARDKVYDAKIAGERIVERTVGPMTQYTTYGPNRSPIVPGTYRLSDYELAYLRSLPSGVSDKVDLFLRDVDQGHVKILPPEDFRDDVGINNYPTVAGTRATDRREPFAVLGHLHILEDDAGTRTEAIESPTGQLIPIGPNGVILGGP